MALDRTTPDPENTAPDIDGANYSRAVNEEVGGIWNRTPIQLTVSSGINDLVCTAAIAGLNPSAYQDGQIYSVQPNANNTAAMRININALGLIDMLKQDGSAFGNGEILSSTVYMGIIRNGGTEFRVFGALPEMAAALNIAIFGLGQPNGTAGGGTVQDVWTRYPLNQVRKNDIIGASLDTTVNVGQFTLPAGRFMIDALAGFARSEEVQLRLFNVSDSVFVTTGHSSFGRTPDALNAAAPGYIADLNLSSPKTFELMYEVELPQGGTGLGVPLGPSGGQDEEYGYCRIMKYQALESRLFMPQYTVAGLPSPAQDPQIVFVTDDVGGAVPAFNDGADWRRVTDRAPVSTT